MMILEYIWLGGNGELRSKTRVHYEMPRSRVHLSDIPKWNYDGSSTGQAEGHSSEIELRPCALYQDPLRGTHHTYLVLCEAYDYTGAPVASNHRAQAQKIFSQYPHEKPWYGIEQEYFLFGQETGFRVHADGSVNFTVIAAPQGPYYCSVGAGRAKGRTVVEEHLMICLKAGLQISGINAEVAPAQWEFQIGPVEGIEAADQLYIARYLLERVAERHGLQVCYDPKPLQGDWNGSGCHTNFSTERMREPEGLDHIYSAIVNLRSKHTEHMAVYGKGNDRRLTGKHETSGYDTFTWGVADRGCSIRIPTDTARNGCGYFEDRRPSANMDPYLVTSKILETVMSE